MTSNTNNNSNQVDDELHEELLYELLLYKKKDIIAIQDINSNTLMAVHQSKKVKTLDDLYELLFNLINKLKLISKELQIGCHFLFTIIY